MPHLHKALTLAAIWTNFTLMKKRRKQLYRQIFILRISIYIFSLSFLGQIKAQCSSGFYSITSPSNSQTINDIDISISSPTNAQLRRSTFGSMTGYFIGDENSTEEIVFTLSKPVSKIRVTARALSAVLQYNKIEHFTIRINGYTHIIQSSELITPDPIYGRECLLQSNGSIMGDTLYPGDGSFIFTFSDPIGISSFVIKDSIPSLLDPAGAFFDVQIYLKCDTVTNVDSTNTNTTASKFFTPNAFTPNGDNKNDEFKPHIIGTVEYYDFSIANRWGQIVYHSNDFTKGWNGRYIGEKQNTNTFIWQCSYKCKGESIKKQKGIVILIN